MINVSLINKFLKIYPLNWKKGKKKGHGVEEDTWHYSEANQFIHQDQSGSNIRFIIGLIVASCSQIWVSFVITAVTSLNIHFVFSHPSGCLTLLSAIVIRRNHNNGCLSIMSDSCLWRRYWWRKEDMPGTSYSLQMTQDGPMRLLALFH